MVRRLRVRTGCANCKSRRIKCDETKPNCRNCIRLGLTCIRPHGDVKITDVNNERPQFAEAPLNGSMAGQRNALPEQSLSLYPSITGSGMEGWSSDTQLYFTMKCPATLEGLIPASAEAVFHDLSFMASLAIRNPFMRDSLAAFAAYMLYSVDTSNIKTESAALMLHSNAVSKIRRHIAKFDENQDRLSLLVAITFLGLFQNLGVGDPKLAITHLIAAAQFCTQIPPESVSGAALVAYRVCVECWLFGLSTLAIFYPGCEKVLDTIDMTIVSRTFSSSGLLGTEASKISPFFLGNHEIYVMMLQVTCYARCEMPSPARFTKCLEWSQNLDILESRLELYYELYPFDVAELYSTKYMLHIHALRIFLCKIQDYDCTTASSAVRNSVHEAWRLCSERDIRERSNPAVAWPLLIFLVAAHEDEVFDFFVGTAIRIRDNFDKGHSVRFSIVLSKLRKMRILPARNKESNDRGYNTMDLLLDHGGILSAGDAPFNDIAVTRRTFTASFTRPLPILSKADIVDDVSHDQSQGANL